MSNPEPEVELTEVENAAVDALIDTLSEEDFAYLPPPMRDVSLDELPPTLLRRMLEMKARDLIAARMGFPRRRPRRPSRPSET